MPKTQIHEYGKTTSTLIRDDGHGSRLDIVTYYPDNDGPTDELTITRTGPDGEDITADIVLTNTQTATLLNLIHDPLTAAAEHLVTLWLKYQDAETRPAEKLARAQFDGAAEIFGATYYHGSPNASVYVTTEIITLWDQEKGERVTGYGTAAVHAQWKADFVAEYAARLVLSILEHGLGVKR